jgi:hypothetical protein
MIGTPTYQVTARLTDGEASVRVTAFCEYGNRTASFTQDITDEKVTASVTSALKKALSKDVLKEVDQQVNKSAMQAYIVATEKGEDLTGEAQEVQD